MAILEIDEPGPWIPTRASRLGQDLLALLEVPDGLRPYFQEPLLEALPQDAGAGGGGVEAGGEHGIGARGIETKRPRGVVGGEHHPPAAGVRGHTSRQRSGW